VPEHTFLFSLRLPGSGEFDDMIADLTENVLRHCGFPPAAISEIGGDVKAAIPAAAAQGDLDVRFEAAGGAIDIVVSRSGREIVRTSRRLP
jgi:hypothetical protein